MIFRVFYLFIFITTIQSHVVETNPEWKRYYRASFIVNEKHDYGIGAYLRLKRTTDYTFRDLRMYVHFIENDSYKKIRYKNSRRLLDWRNIYNYTTVAIDQNTKIGVNIRYHGNQGFGYFVVRNRYGHLNSEIGIAYDISDYLNDSAKTSYFKSGIYWDQKFNSYELKLEIEDFIQITDILSEDLSRIEISIEFFLPLTKKLNFILGYEYEDFKNSKNNINSSAYVSIESADIFDFKNFKKKISRFSGTKVKP